MSPCVPLCVRGLTAGAPVPSVTLSVVLLPALEAAEEAGVLSVVSVADNGASLDCDAAALLVGVVLAAESESVDLAASEVVEVASTKMCT